MTMLDPTIFPTLVALANAYANPESWGYAMDAADGDEVVAAEIWANDSAECDFVKIHEHPSGWQAEDRAQ